uniref:Exoribonuclease phosphorolytic domain-containing protein n=1 Tax=Xenopus tropicalis TaxID=8364 RepID=A0A6I8QUM8_XENTR
QEGKRALSKRAYNLQGDIQTASPRVLGGGDSVGPSAGGSPRDGRGAETRGHLLCDLLEPAMRLDRYPRAEVIVWVLVLEDRGSALPAAVSCASLPLADAGIEMFNLALGCGLSRGPGGELLLDPDDDEEEAGSGGTMSLSLLPTLNQVSPLIFPCARALKDNAILSNYHHQDLLLIGWVPCHCSEKAVIQTFLIRHYCSS